MAANDIQVGGNHYRKVEGEQHWDRAWRLKYDVFQYIITKWVERWRDKGGIEDLKKVRHAIDKYIEVAEAEAANAQAAKAGCRPVVSGSGLPLTPATELFDITPMTPGACDHDYELFKSPKGAAEICIKCMAVKDHTLDDPYGRVWGGKGLRPVTPPVDSIYEDARPNGAGPLWDADEVQPSDRSGS